MIKQEQAGQQRLHDFMRMVMMVMANLRLFCSGPKTFKPTYGYGDWPSEVVQGSRFCHVGKVFGAYRDVADNFLTDVRRHCFVGSSVRAFVF